MKLTREEQIQIMMGLQLLERENINGYVKSTKRKDEAYARMYANEIAKIEVLLRKVEDDVD